MEKIIQNRHTVFQKLLAMVLTLAIVSSWLAVAVSAEDDPALGQSDGMGSADIIITAFEALPEDTLYQECAIGKAISDLLLPSTLAAFDGNNSLIEIDGVTWESDPVFDPESAGEYEFTLVLPDGYIMADDVATPVITVLIRSINIQTAITGITAMMSGGYGSNGKFLAPIEPPVEGSIPISTRAELEAIRSNLNGKYHLTTDIDLSGAEWSPIMRSNEVSNTPFSGTFDGQGFVIKNLAISKPPGNGWLAGLFGYTENATIKNVGLEQIYIDNVTIVSSAGGICGSANNSTIINCYNQGDILAYGAYRGINVGGIVGRTANTSIKFCYNTGNIYSDGAAGGICGLSNSTSDSISNCYNTGNISASSSNSEQVSVGGICGTSHALISYCYNNGELTASSTSQIAMVGGICGSFTSLAIISNCYNYGDMSALSDLEVYAGGISGSGASAIIINSYNIANISYPDITALHIGGIRGVAYSSVTSNCYCLDLYDSIYGNQLTATQMQEANSFAGFDFDNVWDISSSVNNGYPFLRSLAGNGDDGGGDSDKPIKIPDHAVENNGNYYAIYTLNYTWNEAKAYCESVGGHLVTITSQGEQNFLTTLVYGNSKKNMWLGAEKIGSDFQWITGEEMTYINWDPGEPNNAVGTQDAIMMYTYSDSNHSCGKWNDESKNGRNYPGYTIAETGFICEWDDDSVDPDDSDDPKELRFDYVGGKTLNENLYNKCYYSDSYFYDSSYKYRPDLATMSMSLAMSAFGRSGGDYSDKANNVKALMKDMGFLEDSIWTNPQFDEIPTIHSIGVAMGLKPIELSDGTDCMVLAIAVRGGGYEVEWGGNFAIGTDEVHEGFNKARESVLTYLNYYINQQKNNIAGHRLKIWITGYSRGSAVANLVAADLDKGVAIDGQYGIDVNPHDVYAYCFETPAASRSSDTSSSLYYNIFCWINQNDFVPKLAPVEWGYSRYGITRRFPSSITNSDYNYLREKMLRRFETLSGLTKSDYIVDDFEVKTLPKYDIEQGIYLDIAISDIANNVLKSPKHYVDWYQTPMIGAGCILGTGEDMNSREKIEAFVVALVHIPNFPHITPYVLTLTGNGDSLAQGHWPELCLAWLQSMDDNYDSDVLGIEDVIIFSNEKYRLVHINCPVDVEVYNSNNNLVASIIDDIPQNINGSTILATIDTNEQKSIYLPCDEEYSLKLTARETCSMTYTVMEVNLDKSNPTRVVNYFEVEMNENDLVIGSVESLTLISDPSYELLCSRGDKILPSEDLTGNKVAKHNVSVDIQGNGTVIGAGMRIHGEFAKLSAQPDEGYNFEGWYENNAKIDGANVAYRFAVTSDRTLIAKFTADDTDSTFPTITTISLPDGTVGTPYNQTLTTTGDTPITWSIDSGSLPHGLNLASDTGVIYGTPTTVETASFNIKAVNSAGDDTQTLSIKIEAAAPSLTTYTIIATAGMGGSITGCGTYTENSSVTLIATPNSSYIFDGWYENNARVQNATATYSFPATKDRILEARFASSGGDNGGSGSDGNNGGNSGNNGSSNNDSSDSGSGYGSQGQDHINVSQAPVRHEGTRYITEDEIRAAIKLAQESGSNLVKTRASYRDGHVAITPKVLALMDGYEYIHDTTGSPVQVRVRIPEPSKVTSTIQLCGAVTGSEVDRTKARFEKWFVNDIRVVSLHQQETWGQTVNLAARVDFTGMNTQNLHFYSYNKESNKYHSFDTKYGMDDNGYLHFTSSQAGDIVISDGPLTKNAQAIPETANTKSGTMETSAESSSIQNTGDFLRNPESGGDDIYNTYNPSTGGDGSYTTIASAGGIDLHDSSTDRSINPMTIIWCSAAAIILTLFLWTFIPRKDDEYVTVEEFRKRIG